MQFTRPVRREQGGFSGFGVKARQSQDFELGGKLSRDSSFGRAAKGRTIERAAPQTLAAGKPLSALPRLLTAESASNHTSTHVIPIKRAGSHYFWASTVVTISIHVRQDSPTQTEPRLLVPHLAKSKVFRNNYIP
nr:hypothetical protein CFP56_16795 [Quercus suber]